MSKCRFKADERINGKTLLEWFSNKELCCFASWPKDVQIVAKSNGLGKAPFNSMLRNGKWSKYGKDYNELMPGGIYRLVSEHAWYKELNNTGKFVEFPIDKDGDYTLKAGGSTVTLNWNITPTSTCFTFAGWRWEIKNKPSFISALKQGIDKHGNLSFTANDWVRPLIPTATRFWIKAESKTISKAANSETPANAALKDLTDAFKKHNLLLSLDSGVLVIDILQKDNCETIASIDCEAADVDYKRIQSEIK